MLDFADRRHWLAFFFIAFALLLVAKAFAVDPAQAKFDAATALYADRGTPGKVDEALSLLAEAEGLVQDDELKYKILILECASYYWNGVHAEGDQNKMTVFNLGYQKALQAIAANNDYAEGFYWSAANLSRWCEANGILASLGKKKELDDTLNGVLDRVTQDGDGGETYKGWGADRIMGRIYFKAPPFAGGSLELALKHLDKAFSSADNFTLNVMWYAEALYQGDNIQKQTARRILDEMLAKDPNTLNPDRVPETLEDWPDAKKLRAEMGN